MLVFVLVVLILCFRFRELMVGRFGVDLEWRVIGVGSGDLFGWVGDFLF